MSRSEDTPLVIGTFVLGVALLIPTLVALNAMSKIGHFALKQPFFIATAIWVTAAGGLVLWKIAPGALRHWRTWVFFTFAAPIFTFALNYFFIVNSYERVVPVIAKGLTKGWGAKSSSPYEAGFLLVPAANDPTRLVAAPVSLETWNRAVPGVTQATVLTEIGITGVEFAKLRMLEQP